MKVGIVCPYSLSWPGGVQGHVLALSSQLQAMGCETRVIAPCDATPPSPEVIAIGTSRGFDANGSIAHLAIGPAPFVRVGRVLAEESFDLIHIHEPFQAGASIFALIQAGNLPVVGTFHAAAEELDHYKRLRRVLVPLWRRITLHAAVSPAAAALAGRYFGGDYRILPNGVNVELFANGEAMERDPEEFVVLFVGRLEARKGCRVLLDAWHSIERAMPSARLWIVGRGPEEDELRQLASRAEFKKVDFLGSVESDELRRRYKAADLFCSPAVEGESFGIVLLEAMAAGTPVLAADLPGYAAVAQDDAGRLFRAGDAEALATNLVALAGDSVELSALEERGRARAGEFSWTNLATDVLGAYEETLARGGGHRAA